MIRVPSNLKLGQFFYNQDSPDDIGIYKVRGWKEGDGSRTHLYVDSVTTLDEAIRRVEELNSGLESNIQGEK